MTGPWETLSLKAKVAASPFTINRKQRYVFLSPPVIGNRAIYVSDRHRDFSALDRRTLELLWRKPSRGFEPRGMLSDDLIVVGQMPGRLGSGAVGAMQADSGDLVWTLPTRYAGAGHWRGQLVIYEDSGFRIVEPHTGNTLDFVEVPHGLTSAADLCGDTAIFGTFDHHLHPDDPRSTFDPAVPPRPDHGDPVRAFLLSERRLVWERRWMLEMNLRFGLDLKYPASVFVPGSLPDRFVTTRAGSTFGCSLSDGSIVWRAHVSCPYGWPNVHQGRIYVLSIPQFIALDEATGEVIYETTHPELERAIYARTGTIYEGKIAFPTESGHLPVFDLSDGRLVWMHKEAATVSSTAEADGRLLASTGRGHILVFEDTGRPPRRTKH